MAADSAFWRDLEARFRELLKTPEAARLTGTYADGQWTVHDGPSDQRDRTRLHQLFPPLARSGAIAAGVPNGADALDVWLNLLRAAPPYFHAVESHHAENGVWVPDEHQGGWIQDLVSASAEYCIVRAARAFESETTAAAIGFQGIAKGAMDLQQFQSSHRVRAQYFKALAKLSEQLDETWKRVFPPDARLPRETCEGFFEPFVQFGVALYDAYAQELLDSRPSQERYLHALNFDLKTLVCDQIYPYRENPIRTMQDAIEADSRGEWLGEWTSRMGQAWRLFEHSRHGATNDRICREFIDLYGHMPELWSRFIGRIHTAISRRAVHWLAAHAERAVQGGFPKANQADTTEPSGDESTGTEPGPAVRGTNGNGTDRRAAIDAFMLKVNEAGRKITRKDIWTAAGYKNRTEFERFQRGDKRTTRAASSSFNRVLRMTPEHFIRALEKKASK